MVTKVLSMDNASKHTKRKMDTFLRVVSCQCNAILAPFSVTLILINYIITLRYAFGNLLLSRILSFVYIP